jgi:hypothetical protein
LVSRSVEEILGNSCNVSPTFHDGAGILGCVDRAFPTDTRQCVTSAMTRVKAQFNFIFQARLLLRTYIYASKHANQEHG